MVLVGVAYASTGSTAIVAGIHGQSEAWSVSNPFNVLPVLGGRAEETRAFIESIEVAAGGSAADARTCPCSMKTIH